MIPADSKVIDEVNDSRPLYRQVICLAERLQRKRPGGEGFV